MNQATEKGNGIDLRPEWGIFIPSVLVIILISIPAVLYPKAAEEVVSAIYQPFAANFGTLYLWITVGLIILCVYFACSRYGDIKFGDPDEKPEFSLSSWIAMIFCSGVAGAVMFWSIIEPLWDIVQPPQYAAPMSTQAYDWALAYLLLHWGPNAWCTYFITALPIAYMFHIRRKPFLRISSAADMIIGKQKDGLLGRCVDVFFILGLLFCFLDGKQDPALDTQPCQGCAVRKDCLAPGVPHTVLHGVFYIENQGNPHPVFVQQSGVCLPLRMALDGTFRIRAYICAGNIRKVILPAEGSLGAHLTSHGNTHARGCLCPQFAERTAFPFR